ncbi:MAG: hypothetical protein R2800_14235 [Flavipsychrobacter sp.]
MNFELPLREERVKPHQITTLHFIVGFALIGISAFMMAVYYLLGGVLSKVNIGFGESGSTYPPEAYIGIVFLLVGIFLLYITRFKHSWLLQPSNNKKVRIAELVIIIFAAAYSFVLGFNVAFAIYGILAAALFFALFWENNSSISNAIEIADEGVKLPANSKRRKIKWREIENVIYKYNTLTINTVDGRLYQWTIKKTDINQEAFDTFCFAQVKAAEKDRVTDDW